MKYSAFVTEKSRCSNCHENLIILAYTEETPGFDLPAFYVCFACGKISQRGVGIIQHPASDGPDTVAAKLDRILALLEPKAIKVEHEFRDADPDRCIVGESRPESDSGKNDVTMKKCPACGGDPEVIGDAGFLVVCKSCRPVVGPKMPTRHLAEVAWNAVVAAWSGGFATAESK